MQAGTASLRCVLFPICRAGLLAAVAEGPRATEQFAAVVAVFVAALTASARAQDISARFLEQLVGRLQQVRCVAALCCTALHLFEVLLEFVQSNPTKHTHHMYVYVSCCGRLALLALL